MAILVFLDFVYYDVEMQTFQEYSMRSKEHKKLVDIGKEQFNLT